MIESEKFKKMLSILKTNSKDLNISVCIIDYDTQVECDYEVIILYLKETNLQNGATVYKKLIIRSQLYYNEDDGKYYSALDGDIIIEKDRIPTKIDILTEIKEDTFKEEQVNLEIQLLDVDTGNPVKNQTVFMFLSGTPDESIGSAITNRNGKATFNFYIANPNVLFEEEKLLYFEYKGNDVYNRAKSEYIVINLADIDNQDVDSVISTCIKPNQNLKINYKMSLNGMNLVDGFREQTTLDIDEEDLLNGRVLFYLNTEQESVFLGESPLAIVNGETVSTMEYPLDYKYYNQDISIKGVFTGNSFFSPTFQEMSTRFNREQAENINLIFNRINNGFETQLTFETNMVESNFCDMGLDALYYVYGDIQFYLKNANDTWGTIKDGSPFYTTTQITGVRENNRYRFETETATTSIDRRDYNLKDDDLLSIKAVFSGNAVMNSFVKYYDEE